MAMAMMRRYALRAWGRRPDGFALLMAAIGLAGAAIVLARQSAYGPGLNYDSLRFISEARILLEGNRFIGGPEIPFYWPPLYSLSLAIGGLGLFDPMSVAGPLNAIAFGLTVFVVGQYLRRRLASRLMAAWACAMVALSVPLAREAAWALTDTLFFLLMTLALTRADDYLREGKTSALIWAAIFGALAWQTRYLGFVIPAVIGLALLFQQGATPAQRARRVALVGIAAALPMALWMLRIQPGGSGATLPSIDPTAPAVLLRFAGDAMREWAYPVLRYEGWRFLETLPPGGAAPAAVALIVGLTAAIAVLTPVAFRRAGHDSRDSSDGQASRAFGWRSCLLFVGFAATYFALLITIMSFETTPFVERTPTPTESRLDEPRYVLPMYIPLLMAVAIAMDALLSRAARWRASRSAVARVGERTIAVALTAALAVWLAGAAALSLADAARAAAGEFDMEYAMPRWTNSDTLRYLRENPVEGQIYSNLTAFLHHVTGGDYRGFRSIKKDAESKSGMEKVARWVANTPDGTYVFWFTDRWVNRTSDFGAATMRITPGLQPVAELSDGVVFKVNKAYAPRENPYEAAYERIVAGDWGAPAARANFSVYIADGAVAYLKEPCAASDARARELFFLHIFPQDAANLPGDSKEFGFVNADFKFADYGVNMDGKCIAVAPLPDYPIERIRTGQYVAYEAAPLWSAEVNANRDMYMAAYRAIAAGEYGEPAAQGTYAVYRDADSLIYAREPCAPKDTQARFFLHIFPQDAADLPADRGESGFINADFAFAERGADLGGKCIAIAPLPDYPIERIRTGQHTRGAGQLWRAELE